MIYNQFNRKNPHRPTVSKGDIAGAWWVQGIDPNGRLHASLEWTRSRAHRSYRVGSKRLPEQGREMTRSRFVGTVTRSSHAPDCACHEDSAITEPIPQGEQE